MGLSRDIDKIAPAWKDLMEYLESNPEEVYVVECHTPKAARSQRMNWYRVLKTYQNSCFKSENDPDGKKGFLYLFPNLQNRMVQVRGSQVHYTFQNRSEDAVNIEVSLAAARARKEEPK